MTQDRSTNPIGTAPGQGKSENAKNKDWKDPSGDLPGTTAQEEADKKGTGGKDTADRPA